MPKDSSRRLCSMDLHVVVLAAGKGTRMKSARPSAASRRRPADDRARARRAADARRRDRPTVVVGHQAERVASRRWRRIRPHVRGPGATARHGARPAHGRAGARAARRARSSCCRAMCRFCRQNTLESLVDTHRRSRRRGDGRDGVVDDPHGYGRIVRSGEQIARIVEEKDATPAEREIREINSGIYAFALDGLFDAVRSIAVAERAGRVLPARSGRASTGSAGAASKRVTVADADEIRGINSRAELAEVSRIVRQTKNAELMAAGVTIEDPATTYIDPDVEIGADTIIHPGVSLEGEHVDRRRLRDSQRRAHRRLAHRRSRRRSSTTASSSNSHDRRRRVASGPLRTCAPTRRSARARRSATSSS